MYRNAILILLLGAVSLVIYYSYFAVSNSNNAYIGTNIEKTHIIGSYEKLMGGAGDLDLREFKIDDNGSGEAVVYSEVTNSIHNLKLNYVREDESNISIYFSFDNDQISLTLSKNLRDGTLTSISHDFNRLGMEQLIYRFK